MNLIELRRKELLTYHYGCHGNLITIAARYFADAQGMIANMNTIQLKIKELLMYHCGCHGNLVTIAMKYAADVYCPKEH